MCKTIECADTKKAISQAKSIIKTQGGKVSFTEEMGYIVTVEGPKEKAVELINSREK